MTCHITMERIAPPAPLAPTPTLSPAARAFLALHLQPVYCHRWHFAGTQLRASSEAGSATIWRDDLEHLVRLGLLAKGLGCADVAMTDAGRNVLEQLETEETK